MSGCDQHAFSLRVELEDMALELKTIAEAGKPLSCERVARFAQRTELLFDAATKIDDHLRKVEQLTDGHLDGTALLKNMKPAGGVQ